MVGGCVNALTGHVAVQQTTPSPVRWKLLTLEGQGAPECELIGAERSPQSVVFDGRTPGFMSTECSAAVLRACEAAWQESLPTCFMWHGRGDAPSFEARVADTGQEQCFNVANISGCLKCPGSTIPEDVCDQRPTQIVNSGHTESVLQSLSLVTFKALSTILLAFQRCLASQQSGVLRAQCQNW